MDIKSKIGEPVKGTFDQPSDNVNTIVLRIFPSFIDEQQELEYLEETLIGFIRYSDNSIKLNIELWGIYGCKYDCCLTIGDKEYHNWGNTLINRYRYYVNIIREKFKLTKDSDFINRYHNDKYLLRKHIKEAVCDICGEPPPDATNETKCVKCGKVWKPKQTG